MPLPSSSSSDVTFSWSAAFLFARKVWILVAFEGLQLSYYSKQQLITHPGLSIERCLHLLQTTFFESLRTLRGLQALLSVHPVVFEYSATPSVLSAQLADFLDLQ